MVANFDDNDKKKSLETSEEQKNKSELDNQSNETLDNKAEISKAIALEYNKAKTQSPRITAKGRGVIAEQIIKSAKEHNIPIKNDADLVNILETLEVDQEIPLEVYAVVAEIFAYIYKVNQEIK